MEESEYQAELERRISAMESDSSNIGADLETKDYMWMLVLGILLSFLLLLWGAS